LGPVVELGSGDGASRRPRLIGSASFNNLARGGQHRVQRPGWRARPGVAEGSGSAGAAGRGRKGGRAA